MTAKGATNSNAWLLTLLSGITPFALGVVLVAGGDTSTTTTAEVRPS